MIQRLQKEVTELRRQVQSSNETTTTLNQCSSSVQEQQAHPQVTTRSAISSSVRRPPHRNTAGPITRHLGRLVSAEDGVDQFAGTTTGVHFTLTAQQKYQELFHSKENFPEVVFSLYLLPGSHAREQVQDYDENYRKEWFPMSKQHYIHQTVLFFERWANIYPIFTRKQSVSSMEFVLNQIYREEAVEDKTALYQLYLILAIMEPPEVGSESKADTFYSFSLGLQNYVASTGDLSSLQGLLLLIVFLQQSSRHHLIVQMMGTVVRLAQSLGLHRHAR
ncbi:hypothetical protein ONS96_014061 [Cadophora gregata f. sp. sojae]|nr:hypothetical protein ONS96_014061 [Cadophora gregata f. sp. sojae]